MVISPSSSNGRGTVGLSESEMSRWRRDPRWWFIEYYLGYLPARPSPSGARNLGTRIHTALEAYYGYQLDPVLVLSVLYGLAIEQSPDYEKQLRADHELSKIMIEGYLDWVASEGKDAGLALIDTEAEVRVPLPGFEGYVDLRAKLDQVVQDTTTGWMYFLDHKSAGDFERHEMIELDPQMKLYNLIGWLATQGTVPLLGQPLELRPDRPVVLGGIVNTLRKVKRTKTSKPPYYDRHGFRYTTDQLASHLLSVQQVAGEIMNARSVLDAAYAAGGVPEQINYIQTSMLRPVPILGDCAWRCHLSNGMCQMMSDGSTAWMDALVSGGAYVQGDPYERYGRGDLAEVRQQLATR